MIPKVMKILDNLFKTDPEVGEKVENGFVISAQNSPFKVENT